MIQFRRENDVKSLIIIDSVIFTRVWFMYCVAVMVLLVVDSNDKRVFYFTVYNVAKNRLLAAATVKYVQPSVKIWHSSFTLVRYNTTANIFDCCSQ